LYRVIKMVVMEI